MINIIRVYVLGQLISDHCSQDSCKQESLITCKCVWVHRYVLQTNCVRSSH